MAYDAFISYRRSDRITADGVVRFLDAFGLTTFVDRSSRAGTEWEPELWAALASAKVLVVLWSRSAAASSWVEKEWRHVGPQCRIVPVRLDGEPLPQELNRLTAVEGLDVGTRLLQRTFELMRQQGLSPAQTQAQLVQELAEDGIVLEPKRRDALGILLGFLAGIAGATAMRFEPAILDDRPTSRQRTTVGLTTAASLAVATATVAWGVGYWLAPNAQAATCPECPPTKPAATQVSAPNSAPTPASSSLQTSPPCPSPKLDADCRCPEVARSSTPQCPDLAPYKELLQHANKLQDALENCEKTSVLAKAALAARTKDLNATHAVVNTREKAPPVELFAPRPLDPKVAPNPAAPPTDPRE